MRNTRLGAIVAALVLALASGCEDESARKSIDKLQNDNEKLQTQVGLLEKRLQEVHTATNFDEVIEQKVNARLKEIEAEQRAKTDANTKSIKDFVDGSIIKFDQYNEAMRAQMGDKDTAGFIEEHLKNQIAAQAQAEREAREKLKEEILRYIDSQLKDIYPFAFKKQRTNEPRKQHDPVDLIP